MIRPFDYSEIERDQQGISRYMTLPGSLVEMLRATVDRVPGNEAIVELGGERIDYSGFWDRSARVPG